MKEKPRFLSPKVRLMFVIKLSIATICFLALAWAARPVRISGFSMAPWVFTDSWVTVNCYDKNPDRGDVITLHLKGEKSTWIKRVMALEGDIVEIRQGVAYVNGKESVCEKYVLFSDPKSMKKVKIPKGHVFIVGDHRPYSYDSRIIGPVPAKYIEGVVVFRF